MSAMDEFRRMRWQFYGLFGVTNPAEKDPDEVWTTISRELEQNRIYRFVGKGEGQHGELVKAYFKDGENGVLAFARVNLASLFYEEPKRIYKEDYAKWRKMMLEKFSTLNPNTPNFVRQGEFVAVTSALLRKLHSFLARKFTRFKLPKFMIRFAYREEVVHDYTGSFESHITLWHIMKRGVDGETIIHYLLSKNDDLHIEIATILIKAYPGLSGDIFLSNEYFGYSALHQAIVRGDLGLAKLLLDSGALPHARAQGRFFMPEGIGKNMDYSGMAYYGEYPLSFAVSYKDKDMYDLLLEHGADPNLKDTFGNTVLHIAVIDDSVTMYSYAVKHWIKKADPTIKNNAGYTPLALAVMLGRRKMFDKLMEDSKVKQFQMYKMECSAYGLDGLDTIREDGSTDYGCALFTAINGRSEGHLNIISSDVVQKLLEHKWERFAKGVLFRRMNVLGLHLFTLMTNTLARWLTKTIDSSQNPNESWKMDSVDIINAVIWILLTIAVGCAMFFIYEQISEIQSQGFSSYQRNMRTTPAKCIYIIGSLAQIASLGVKLAYTIYNYQLLGEIFDILLVVVYPSSFMYLMFFARAFKSSGPFVQIIYKMIAEDLTRFSIIVLIFMLPFTISFNFLGEGAEQYQQFLTNNSNKAMKGIEIDHIRCDVKESDHLVFTYHDIYETFLTLFRAMMGNYDYEEFSCFNYPMVTKFLFVFYMLILHIILLNILIATMGHTYNSVTDKAEKSWNRQFAQIIVSIERSFSKEKLAAFYMDYSVKMREKLAFWNQIFIKNLPSNLGSTARGLIVNRMMKDTMQEIRYRAAMKWKVLRRKIGLTVRIYGLEMTQNLLHGVEMPPEFYENKMMIENSRSAELVQMIIDHSNPDRHSPFDVFDLSSPGIPFPLLTSARIFDLQRTPPPMIENAVKAPSLPSTSRPQTTASEASANSDDDHDDVINVTEIPVIPHRSININSVQVRSRLGVISIIPVEFPNIPPQKTTPKREPKAKEKDPEGEHA